MESGDGFLLNYHIAEGRRAERATPPRISFITAFNTVLKVEPSCSNHLLKLSIPLKKRWISFLVRYMCASSVCGYEHVSTGACRGQMRLNPWSWGACEPPDLGAGTKLKFSARAVSALHC